MYNPIISPLSYNNSFKFGYNGIWFNSRESVDDKWQVSFNSVSRIPSDFKTECMNTAKLIRESTDLPLDVLFSGGMDSEVMIDSFVEAKIPINVVIMKFKDNYNAHDINYAFKYCESKNITPTVIDLDILHFFKNDAYIYAEQTYCVNPLLLPHMWLIDQCNNYVVLGVSDPFLYKNVLSEYGKIPDNEWWRIGLNGSKTIEYDGKWYHREIEPAVSIHRHFMKDNRIGCPGFFGFNSELLLSFLLEDEIVKAVSPDSNRVSTFYSKYDMYHRYWKTQTRPKFDGFEIARHATNIPKLRAELESLYPGCKQSSKMEYNDIIKMLNG